MSKYVSRDGGGIITGAFTARQPGVAEELLDDDNAELVAFLAGMATAINARATRRATFANDAGASDLLTRARSATPAEIDTWLANNVTNLAQARTVLGTIIKMLVARVL